MTFDVTIRRIDDDGRWEEWVVTVDAADRASALAKVLRRRGQTAYLLGGGRFRFQAQKIR